jgi:hypothetical protein
MAQRIAILFRWHDIMSANIDALLLGIIAKAHWYDVGITLLINGCQPAKTLALQIGDFFGCKSTHL